MQSMKIGWVLLYVMAFTGAINVKVGTITSSSGSTLVTLKAI